jgi:hypothetical protein
MRLRTIGYAGGLGALALALGACGATRTVPGPTVTVTVPGPARTVQVPGPTVTVTAQPPVLLNKKFSGSGSWNSPPFTVCDNAVLGVAYSFSGNGDQFGASNFTADIVSPGDDQSIANVIQSAGGTKTTIYPDTGFGGKVYHLSVTASGKWSFTISETC